MNRESLINDLAEASTLREDTIINPVMTYVRRDILKATVSMLVVDKITMKRLVNDHLNYCNQLRDQIKELREEIKVLGYEIRDLETRHE